MFSIGYTRTRSFFQWCCEKCGLDGQGTGDQGPWGASTPILPDPNTDQRIVDTVGHSGSKSLEVTRGIGIAWAEREAVSSGVIEWSFWIKRNNDYSSTDVGIRSSRLHDAQGAYMYFYIEGNPLSGRLHCNFPGGDIIFYDYVVPTQQWVRLRMVSDLDRGRADIYFWNPSDPNGEAQIAENTIIGETDFADPNGSTWFIVQPEQPEDNVCYIDDISVKTYPSLSQDLNRDHYVDYKDFKLFLLHWLD